MKEETGLDIEVIGVIGIYSDPHHTIEFSDGEVRQQFNICFSARVTGGTLMVSSESSEVRFADPPAIKALPMHDTTRLRIAHFLEQRIAPYIG